MDPTMSTPRPRMPVIPFATAEHPQWQRAEEHSHNWAIEIGLLRGTEAQEQNRSSNFGKIIACMYPRAEFDDVCDAVSLWKVFNILDDMVAAGGFDRESDRQALTARIAEIFDSPRDVVSNDPWITALAELVRKMYSRRPGAWRNRFQYGFSDAVSAMCTEIEIRCGSQALAVDDYIVLRRRTSAAPLTAAIFEYLVRADIPGQIYTAGEFVTFATIVNDIGSWTNDLFSYEKEDLAGEKNLVHALCVENGIPPQAACDMVTDSIESRVEDLRAAEKALLDSHAYTTLAAADREVVDIMLESAKCLLAMNVTWCTESSRYTSNYPADYRR